MYPKIKVDPGRGRPLIELQQSYDTDLNTDNKTVVGAINELLDNINSSELPEKSVFNAFTHYDFPSVGDTNIIYKAQSEGLIYQWNPMDLKYDPIGSPVEIDTSAIELINGGNAYGDT